jgi:lipopolysaccharide export LptBFGC system permease protein LptF
MRPRKLLLERYIVSSISPYLVLSFLILTALLLTQQAGKFTEALSYARSPLSLTLEIASGVLPGIMIFTLPMSVLVGTATGFARLGSDSELVALRAAGISRWRLTLPLLFFGILLSTVTVFDGFAVAPHALRVLRQVFYRAALDRLESPIQPGSFNTQMPGKVIYVREGDEARGEWGRVFIHWSEPGGDLRLVTARSGRLDVGGEQTELVLTDAVVITIGSSHQVETPEASPRPASVSDHQVVTEKSAQFRLRINSGRAAIAEQMSRGVDYDEMGWADLRKKCKEGSAIERRDALSSLHKRLSLALTPIPFILLGVGLGTRARRGGRALGAFLSFFAMIFYYLLFLGGDYLARTGVVSPLIGAWMAAVLTFICGVSLILLSDISGHSLKWKSVFKVNKSPEVFGVGGHKTLRLSLLGLLDRSILASLILYFLVALIVLVAVFLIFTFFETLRFIAFSGSQPRLIPLYLLYLTPLAVVGVLPVATLLSVLTTYSLMARRSEVISWWSSGQSLYRLALPSFGFALCVCALYWAVQERILPLANVKQEALRSRIRGEPARADAPSGYLWLAASDRELYSYKYHEDSETLENPVLYRFDDEGVHLDEIVQGKVGRQTPRGTLLEGVRSLTGLARFNGSIVEGREAETIAEFTSFHLFKPHLKQVSEYKTSELNDILKDLSTRRTTSPRFLAFAVAVWRREVEPFTPLLMWVNGLPLAVAFGRRTVIRPLVFAIFIGLGFWLGSALLGQAGVYGLISPGIAVLLLPFLFLLSGIYYFSKAYT